MPKTIEIKSATLWDSMKEEFIEIEDCSLTFEHSLISISKWESKWHKPFLTNEPKSAEETIDYLKCMVINHSFNPKAVEAVAMTPSLAKEINDYIEDPMTATTFNENMSHKGGRKEIVTSELIYYWMTAYQIPVEFEKWHLNRLLTLIRICGIKNDPNQKKMGRKSIYSQNRALNAARRKALGSRG